MRRLVASLYIVVLLGCGADTEGPTGVVQPGPEAVTLSVVSVDATAAELKWSVSPASNFAAYELYRNSAPLFDDLLVAVITNPHAQAFHDTGLEPSTTYYYRVFVRANSGETARSNEVSVTTLPDLEPVLLSVVSVDATGVELTWTKGDASSFGAYRLYRSRETSHRNTIPLGQLVVEIDEPNLVTFRDGGLTPSTTYSYRLYIVGDGGQTVRSNEVSATTLAE